VVLCAAEIEAVENVKGVDEGKRNWNS